MNCCMIGHLTQAIRDDLLINIVVIHVKFYCVRRITSSVADHTLAIGRRFYSDITLQNAKHLQ